MVALWSFLLDRLDVERSILRFPSPLHASEVALRILAKGNWKIESFLWGGRFGRSLLCPGRAEKKTRGSCPPTGCLPVDRNKLGPDSWRDERGVCDRTDRQTDTHTHGIKAVWTARAPALARTWPPARIKAVWTARAPALARTWPPARINGKVHVSWDQLSICTAVKHTASSSRCCLYNKFPAQFSVFSPINFQHP